MRRALGRGLTVVLAVATGLLTGCAGFFPPLNQTPTTTPPTTTNGDFVYVANTTTNSVAAFTVATGATGAGTLTSIAGSPYGLPLSPTAMAITPSNSFLYVGGIGGIYAYSINSSTGALTAALSGGAAVITTYPAVSMDVSPDGQWLFALSGDGVTLQEYQINATTGALGAISTSSYTGLGGAAVAKMVRVAPGGAYIALALGTGGDLVVGLTTSTGALAVTSSQALAGQQLTEPANSSDNALAFDAATGYLYVARSGASSGLAVYSVGAGGALSGVTGSPFAAGAGPYAVALDATGKYVYAANRTDGTISGFAIGTGGVLTAIAGSPFTSGTGAASLARDNSGKYLLAAASGGTPDLALYGFDATTAGKLDLAASATTGTDPTGASIVVASR